MLDSQTRNAFTSRAVATTNNWDTVFGIDFKGVNDGIVADAQYPKIIQHPEVPQPADDTLTGSFSSWKLVGGAGHLLEMEMDIPSFTMTLDGDPAETRDDAVVRIQVDLECFMGEEGTGTGGGTPVAFRFKPAEHLLSNAATQAVTVVMVTWQGSETDPIRDDVRLLFAQYFNRSDILEKFDHTFAIVDINSKLSQGEGEADFSWLAPTDTSYGVLADESAAGGGVFAVLCMVQGHEAPVHHNVSPEILASARSGFLINKPIFLEHFVKPGLALMFGREIDDTDFIEANFSTDGDTITNINRLTINDFEIEDGDMVTAEMARRTFNITMNDTAIELQYQGLNHPYGKFLGGYAYRAYHYLTMDVTASFDADTKKFELIPPDPEAPFVRYRASLEKSELGEWVDRGLLLLDIVGVAGAFFNGLAVVRGGEAVAEVAQDAGYFARALHWIKESGQGIANFLKNSPVGVWVAFGIGAAGVGAGIYKNKYEEARESDPTLIKPDMQEFATNILAPYTWPADSGLEVTGVAINGGFHITGNPSFGTGGAS